MFVSVSIRPEGMKELMGVCQGVVAGLQLEQSNNKVK